MPSCNWCRHVYREFNKEADALATRALTIKDNTAHLRLTPANKPLHLRATFDGGRRGTEAGGGWT
eukprot:8627699-Karenia_brevis.AAC.1